jgi:hypothetical protein
MPPCGNFYFLAAKPQNAPLFCRLWRHYFIDFQVKK